MYQLDVTCNLPADHQSAHNTLVLSIVLIGVFLWSKTYFDLTSSGRSGSLKLIELF